MLFLYPFNILACLKEMGQEDFAGKYDGFMGGKTSDGARSFS